MAKNKKTGSGDSRPTGAIGRIVLRVTVVTALAAGVFFGMKMLERQVLSSSGSGVAVTSVRAVLAERPAWMPARLARKIAASLTPGSTGFNDLQLTANVYRLAEKNPWVRQVLRVQRRQTDNAAVAVVEVCAEFRQPVAKVNFDCNDYYVDDQGYHLPSGDVPQWVVWADGSDGLRRQSCYIDYRDVPAGGRARGIHYFSIQGVAAEPPAVGQRWKGELLAEGLRLVKLIRTRPYADQITVVDVRNHRGRISRNEPWLRMFAQLGRGRATDIRFGRFPAPGGGDYVVSPERKMSYLDAYFADHGGKLAGLNRYIDLRYDEMHVSIN